MFYIFADTNERKNVLCNPRKNLTILRNKFLVKRQDEDQSFNDFVADLKRLSTDCEFGAIRDDLVKDMIVT